MGNWQGWADAWPFSAATKDDIEAECETSCATVQYFLQYWSNDNFQAGTEVNGSTFWLGGVPTTFEGPPLPFLNKLLLIIKPMRWTLIINRPGCKKSFFKIGIHFFDLTLFLVLFSQQIFKLPASHAGPGQCFLNMAPASLLVFFFSSVFNRLISMEYLRSQNAY